MRKLIPILIFIISFYGEVFCQDKIMEVGEELYYKVYYGFLTLGEVKVRISDYDKKNSIYTAIASMKSYEGIPFVNIDYIFESTIYKVKDSIYSKKFFSTEFKEGNLTHLEYIFDYNGGVIKCKKDHNWNVDFEKEVKNDQKKKYQDGLSMFYHARINSLVNRNYIVPVFVNEEESTISYSFNMNKDVISLDISDYDISAIKIMGKIHFVGVYGLTGEFMAWLSDDEYRIPLKAKFGVTIGNITLELVRYQRRDWKPPVYGK